MTSFDRSLSHLLELTAWHPAHWLAGDPQVASIKIQWVTADLATAQDGDLLLVPAGRLTRRLVSQAQRAGVVAVLVLGRVDQPEQFQEAGIPIISLPDVQGLRDAQERLLTILIDQRAQIMEWGISIYAQLSQLEAEGGGLVSLARAMMEISGQGVVLQDKRLNVLASSPSPALALVWDELMTQLSARESLPETLRDRKQAGQQAMIITQTLPGGLARVVTPVRVGGVARGYLSLVGPDGELDILDQVVIEKGAVVSAIEMSRSKAIRETEKRLHGDLLAALLQGSLEPRDARLWAQAMGLDLTQTHLALRFAWDTPTPPSRRRLETLVNGEVASSGLTVIVHPMGSEVICFCQIPPGKTAQPALRLGQKVLDRALQENPAAPVRCGVGSAAADLSTWRSSFRQAGQALEMARRLSESQPLYFPELSVYRLLLQLEYNPELRDFQGEILGSLLAYDTGEELIRTLNAYFEHNGNLSQTADALFIHRNTLLYRMERIAEITGLNLDNPETRLALQLALHIRRMLGATGRPPGDLD